MLRKFDSGGSGRGREATASDDTSMHHFEDLLSSAALHGIRELNRNVLALLVQRRRDDMFRSLRGQSWRRDSSNRLRNVRLVVQKLIYNAESPGKSDSPPKVLALEPINR